MNLRSMTPVKLRLILSLSLLILSVIGIGLFAIGYSRLKTFAIAAEKVTSQAQASQSSVQDLVSTKKTLEQDADAVNRASQLVAESKSYVYQDQIINDINKYANQAGLTITNISFSTPTTAPVGATSTPTPSKTPSETPSMTPSSTTGTIGTATPAGVKSMTASVTLKSPADYLSILNFIHYIEQSLFRMQISQVGISASGDTTHPDQVSSDVLTIEVYVR